MKRIIVPRSILTLAALVAVLRLSRRTGPFNLHAFISRRKLMQLGGLGLTALLTGARRSRSSIIASNDAVPPNLVSCVLTPEQTEGPYYIAREKVRRDITEHRSGTPLKLRLTVVDAATCKPIKGAAVDIWHCDAGGIYSGFIAASTGGAPSGGSGPTDKRTFLRGIQFTDARGYAEFLTIYPGWYRGRTVHIHVKVHLNHDTVGHVVHTGQLYFQDSLTGKVYQAQPYKARAAARDTFNNTDGIFQDGGRQSLLRMKRDRHGSYSGTIILGVRRS
jgi:protocatechuate 3,4-dioxygenase beta subunit